jgi:hypothetical protein
LINNNRLDFAVLERQVHNGLRATYTSGNDLQGKA